MQILGECRGRSICGADESHLRLRRVTLALRLPAGQLARQGDYGCPCGGRKDASLVQSAFSSVVLLLVRIEVFYSNRVSELRTALFDWVN